MLLLVVSSSASLHELWSPRAGRRGYWRSQLLVQCSDPRSAGVKAALPVGCFIPGYVEGESVSVEDWVLITS